jgi:hypothetical protein
MTAAVAKMLAFILVPIQMPGKSKPRLGAAARHAGARRAPALARDHARGIVGIVIYAQGRAVAARLPGGHQAIGGGGLAHWIVRLFIWHEIFRLARYLWRIPGFGPFIVILIIAVLIGLSIWRRKHGPIRRRQSGPAGRGPGTGPRDW